MNCYRGYVVLVVLINLIDCDLGGTGCRLYLRQGVKNDSGCRLWSEYLSSEFYS